MRVIISALLLSLLSMPIISFSQNVGRKGDSLSNYVDINGMKQGYWLKQDENGNNVFEGTFKNNEPIGLFKKFHPNGVVKAEMNFDKYDQKKVNVKMFDSSGELSAEGAYYDKKKEGLWKFYGQQEKLIAEETYTKGVLNGVSKNYYKSGGIQEIKMFKNGLMHGEWKWFYENGKPRLSANHTNGKRSGAFYIFYESGFYYIKGAYKDDYKDGDWYIYDEKGSQIVNYHFTQGVADNQDELDRKVTEELKEMESKKGLFKEPSMR